MPEEKIRRQENANMEAMMKIHARIEAIVKDKATAARRSSRSTC